MHITVLVVIFINNILFFNFGHWYFWNSVHEWTTCIASQATSHHFLIFLLIKITTRTV